MGRRSEKSCRNLCKVYKCCHRNRRIYFLYFYLWQITTVTLRQIQTTVHISYSYDLYLPHKNLAIYQKGVYYSGVKIFNNLPSDIKNISGNLKRI